MKKVIDVSIGRVSFTIDEDAYFKLQTYLSQFRSTIEDPIEANEVMEDVEARVAEIFMDKLKFNRQVVDLKMVDNVISHLGELDSEPKTKTNNLREEEVKTESKRLFRDTERRSLAGVCSGISYYVNIDVTIIRILFAVLAVFYGFAIILYIILWIVMPQAKTVPQKLQMMGITPTAENIRAYTFNHKN